MAVVYPAGNPGEYPLDPTSDVGKFRLAYGDTQSTPYDPVVPDIQNYTELSDAEIELFLSQGGDSVNRAIGFYYMRLAGEAAKISKVTADYDLRVDLTKRATDLREMAQWYFDQALTEEGEGGFFIVPTGRPHVCCTPELAPFDLSCHRGGTCRCGRC